MKTKFFCFLSPLFLIIGCSSDSGNKAFSDVFDDAPKIKGKPSYLNSPYVTAGDRVYMVGHQNGSFPELGWHIKDEMGGIWNHPIKLMDGFDVILKFNNENISLNSASSFTNYPFGNKHQFSLTNKNLEVDRFQFVPDSMSGISVEYTFRNTGSEPLKFEFEFIGHSDLRPTWLGERTQMMDGVDTATFLDEEGKWLVKDENNTWYVIYGSKEQSISHSEIENNYLGTGISNSLNYAFEIGAGETKNITFIIAGSYTSKEDALQTYEAIQENSLDYLSSKKERYALLANQSKLTISDKNLEQAFEWLKYNCDWLIQTVPEIGTGITAGIPDYPWWFGVDSEYALKGYMAIGQTDAVYSTIICIFNLGSIPMEWR